MQDKKTYEMLVAFTAGVNAGIFEGGGELDKGFNILDCEPTSYDISDVISTQLYFSLSLTHWLGKLTRFLILEKESPEIVDKLDPVFAPWNNLIKPVGVKSGPDDKSLYKELVDAKKILNTKGASNNWCLSGKKTETGRPLVDNDPHLAADVPAPWYLASIASNDFKICGACYPGSPIFFNGHNGSVGWAMTAAFIDNVDLYLEKFNSEKNATLIDGDYQACDTVVEEIPIKDKNPHNEEVIIGRHGPILSPAIRRANNHVISMCATWFKPKPVNGFLTIHKAKDVHQVREMFRDWPFTSTNLVMADTVGNICWQLCGEIPDRKKSKGMLPMPGWDSSYDWNETIVPYEKNATILNPKEEFIATANNKHTKMEADPYTGRDFIDGYRHRRVVNLLRSKEKWNLNHTAEMQLDRFSGPWEDIRDAVLEITTTSEKGKKALNIFKEWDGFMRSESSATTIYEYFIAGMTKRIVAEISPNSQELIYETYNPAVGSACFAMSRISQVIQFIREQPNEMFGNNWNEVLNSELVAAVEKLESELGEEVSKWEWGDYRPLLLKHPINRNIKEYDTEEYQKILNLGPVTWGGDEQTLNVAAGSMLDPTVTPDFIPNLRSVIDVSNWDENYFSLAGGQSSDPTSKHYSDLFNLWKDGKGIQIAWSKDKIKEISTEELEITPKK